MTRISTIFILASAFSIGACGDSPADRDINSPHGEHPNAAAHPSVALTGCMEPGESAGEYRLGHVRRAPLGAQPAGSTSTPIPAAITEGSWVRLTASDEDELRKHLGQEVAVVGTMIESGRNTIGTSGYQKGAAEPESRTDASAQPKDESYPSKMKEEAGPLGQQANWNGFAPMIAVERVAATGQTCEAR